MSARITFLRNKFNLAVDKEKEKLFNINWITKLCKHPSKATFLKAAPEYSVKLLFKAVTSVLKLMCKQVVTYNFNMYYFSMLPKKLTVQQSIVNSNL